MVRSALLATHGSPSRISTAPTMMSRHRTSGPYPVTTATGSSSFDPTGSTFLPPFFAGPGFTAAKYLASPTGAGEIQLFSNTINGGAFNDAQNTTQLYRYLSGNISPAAGDEPCTYTPSTDRVCYINEVSAQDMRFFQSSTPLTLGQEFSEMYLRVKREEWESYHRTISPWELENYATLY